MSRGSVKKDAAIHRQEKEMQCRDSATQYIVCNSFVFGGKNHDPL